MHSTPRRILARLSTSRPRAFPRPTSWRPKPLALAPVAALSLVIGGLATGQLPGMSPVADVTEGLVLWYKLDEASGTVAADASGNGRNGTVNGTAAWSGAQGLEFNGSNTYVKVPDNVMAGLSSISVDFDVNIAAGQASPYFLYGFGNTDTSTGWGNGYLFATGNAFRNSISLSNWSGEQNTRPADGHNLARGTWKHVTYTQTGTTGTLYEDGVPVATNTSISILPSAIGNGTTTANYIGRSVYPGDRYFQGKLRDFRVFDRALSGSEVAELATRANTEAVAADTAALSLGDTSAVISDLTLPKSGTGGTTIAWASSDPAVVSDTGVVTRGNADATVTLTATISRGGISGTKEFTVVVPAANDAATAEAAAKALVVRNVDDVRGNLTLPATGESGTTVTWSSSDPSVIAATGEVHRPAHGAGPASVTLTATVTLNGATATREFTATVPALPAQQAYEGYLFSYFTGEGTSNGEQVYNALSNGNNALSWREINNGQPVLTSTLGTAGLRDPFIIRSPEGDKFYQIATDLKIYGNGDWDASQRTGSKSIMVWESTDLVHWTDQRLVKVSPDTAGNTWAPEAFYDESIGAYVVFWASKLYDVSDPNHTGSTYNRMMYATTRDFHTFSEPKVWKDPGYSVIDSTVVKHDGTYHRITKDERNNSSSTPCSKFLIQEKSAQLRDLDYDFVAECIGKGSLSAGEGPLIFKSNTEEKWYLFIDEFGGRGYVPFETTDLDSGTWTMVPSYNLPSRPRHGTVLPVTAAEYNRLLQAYQPDQYAVSVNPVSVTTGAGQAPVLPAAVPATYGDGVTRSAAVDWDAVDPSAYEEAGTFTVRGTLVDNATLEVTATVTVGSDPVPQSRLKLRYQFDETGGAVARDSSGNGYDGTYNRTPAWTAGVEGGAVSLSGGASTSTTAPYVTIPNGVLKGANSVTVSLWAKWNASTTVNQWLYGLGPDSTKYLFTGPRNGSGVLVSAITTGSWSSEFGMRNAAALPGGSWQHLAVTVDSSTQKAVMYLNGAAVATATGVTVKPSDLYDATKTYSGYVGRSLYSADPYFAGSIDDFRIYDAALSPAEILELAGKSTSVAAVTLPQLKVDALIDDASSTITLPLRPGSDVTKLAPEFTLANGATISPASGTERDFTQPVTYTITGADGESRTWTVKALVMRSPVLPGLYADPNIAVFGDTFWIYPTTDGFAGWSGTQFHAFSSKDLVNWTDHGVALDLGPDVSWADDSAWAPAIAEKNGKYYLYFSGGASSGDTRKQLGVAVADSPAGPFTDALGKPLVAAGTYSGQMIDPAVFTDDDGTSYLYWGNGNSYQVPLGADMTSFDAAQVKTYHPTNYNEGSFVIKRGGTYYFMWSENDTRSPDYRVAYATGSSPLGPWSERAGVILQKDAGLGILGTGHHSVVQVPGTDDWYMAYHRFAIPGGDGTHRETTIDRMRFNADGSIAPVTPTLESVAPVTLAGAGADVTGVEGSPVALQGSTSNEANRPTWSYTAGAGVDAGAACTFADLHAARTSVTCTDDGTYTVTLTAGGAQDSAEVTVTNAAPVVTPPGGRPAPSAPVATGTAVDLSAGFGDAGLGDVHTCTADWGDGSTSAGVVAGGECQVSHPYTRAGVFRPRVTVSDDDGGTGTVTMPFVATYVPGAGSAAGSGWFTSPAGSLRGSAANLRVTGPADFAFTAGSGGAGAGGRTWFRFAAGDLVLQSTSQGPVKITKATATYTGTGSVNGAGSYGFQVWVTDGALVNGGRGADLVRIKIWEAGTGKVVYDLKDGKMVRLAAGGTVVSPKS
jgi:beta-xylosidase